MLCWHTYCDIHCITFNPLEILMRQFKAMAQVLVLASSLWASFAAQAADRSYTMAISWQPAFCETKPNKLECQTSTPARFDATHFTLHGLWPEGAAYCGVSRTNKTYDTSNRWNKLPSVDLSSSTRALLNREMPGTASYLERHEWIKHGTCSGYSQETYFAGALSLLTSVYSTNLQALIVNNIGRTVTVDDMYAAAEQDYGMAANSAIEFICSNVNNKQYLSELRYHLNLPANLPQRILPANLTDPITPASPSQLCDGAVYIDVAGVGQ
jgi:ribonuclease T2